MRIATYNVSCINGRLPLLLGWLKAAEPDIVCLQELKAPDDKFLQAAIRAVGYGAVWHGKKSWNGVAILARVRSRLRTRTCARASSDAKSCSLRDPGVAFDFGITTGHRLLGA
jgi:exodeoxyribonuclease-3